MKNTILLGILGAVFTGLMIGSQATLSTRLGNLIGPGRTGLWMNVAGGGMALAIVGVVALFSKTTNEPISLPGWGMLLVAGLLGVIIVTGTAFALPKIGITAGIAALILGQIIVSTLSDAMGWGGQAPIPINLTRIAGLVLLGFSVFLLLPRDQ